MRRPSILVLCGVAVGCGSAPERDAVERTQQALGTAIYVDCTAGIDDAAGTTSAPVKTIRRAMRMVQPGGAIYIRPGVCTERVDVTVSNLLITRDPATPGVAEVAGNSPIRRDYTNLAKCNPGAGVASRACNEGARSRYSTFDVYDVHDVTISNLKITHDQNVYCPASTPETGCAIESIYNGVNGPVSSFTTETFGPYYQQSCLIDPNPDGLQNRCEERPTTIAGADGLFSGCCIVPRANGTEETYCNQPAGSYTAPDTRPPHVCGRPLMFGAGISVGGASRAIRIDGNDLTHIVRGARAKWMSAAIPIIVNSRESDDRVVSDVHVVNNTLHDMPQREIDGNTFGGVLVSAEDNVDGFEVGNNTIQNVGGGIFPSGNYAFNDQPNAPPLSIASDRARNVWIHDNRITNAASYAIYLDGARRALVERNRITDSWAGIGVTTEVRRQRPVVDENGNLSLEDDPTTFTSDIWIRDNIVASTGATVGAIRPAYQTLAAGMWSRDANRAHYNPVTNVFVSNNTFALMDLTTTASFLKGNTVNALPGIRGQSGFQGNIIMHVEGNALDVTTTPTFGSTAVYSYNDYYASASTKVVTTAIRINGIASTPSALGDATGLTVFPGLTSSYAMTSTSPLRNRVPIGARTVPAWATGYPFTQPERDVFSGPRACSSVDIGADEYSELLCF